MKKLLIPIAFAAVLAFTPTTAGAATTLSTALPEYLGSVDPGSPANPADEVVYINLLLSLSANAVATIDGHTYDTSLNDCAGCPAAVLSGQQTVDTGGPVLALDVSLFTYLLVKYGNTSYVWNVANFTTVDIPSTLNGFNGPGTGLSHYALFTPAGGGVPDGGTTAGLLGLAMLGLGYLRRRMG